jgi:Fe-S-cluster containining protein
MTRVVRCQDCSGLCCQAFDALVFEPGDIPRLAQALGMPQSRFERKYVSYESPFDLLLRILDGRGPEGQRAYLEINMKACPFLDRQAGRCTVYAARPRACRVFKPGNDYCRRLRAAQRQKDAP